MEMIFENQMQLTDFERKDDELFEMRYLLGESTQPQNTRGGDKERSSFASGLISGKLSDLDEAALRASIIGIIENRRRILVVKADWIDLLDFKPTLDEE